MKMKKTPWIVMTMTCLLPLTAMADPDKGEREFILFDTDTIDQDFDNNFDASGRGYLFEELLIGVHRSLDRSGQKVGDPQWNSATRDFYRFHFDINHWQPLIDADPGSIHGDDIVRSRFAGTEAGIKYHALDNTFINLVAEYQFFSEYAGDADDAFENGALFYGLDIGYNF